MKASESKQNLAVSGVTGLVTGGPIGLVLSPGFLWVLHKAGFKNTQKWIIWGVIGIFAGPLSWGIFAPASTNPLTQPQSSAPTVQQKEAPKNPGIGSTVSESGRSVRIDSIERHQGLQANNQFAKPIDGSIVLVYATFSNTSNEQGNFIFSAFDLTDSQGRKYEEITDLSYSLWRDENGFKSRSEDYYPGESRKEVIAFRVAPDAQGFQMGWKGHTIELTN